MDFRGNNTSELRHIAFLLRLLLSSLPLDAMWSNYSLGPFNLREG
jgi:hypothetical protein